MHILKQETQSRLGLKLNFSLLRKHIDRAEGELRYDSMQLGKTLHTWLEYKAKTLLRLSKKKI